MILIKNNKMYEIPKTLIEKLENKGYSVVIGETDCCISKYSSAGQDFFFTVDIGENLNDFAENIYDYGESFDVDEEAYLWIGSDGHGINGAPYHISDIVKDMEECGNMIYEAYKIVTEYIEKK